MEIILEAGPVVKLVMITLAYCSVVSWAIIGHKYVTLRRAQNASLKFLDHFWTNKNLDVTARNLRAFSYSPLAFLFREAYNGIHKVRSDGLCELGADERDGLSRTLRRATTSETHKLESKLSFLATTASTAPFIGLFGTVWGIMDAFKGIGESGGASLAVVAPGISEALIATAIGLVAAIPAAVAYNYFVSKVNYIASEMESFSLDLISASDRLMDR